MAALAAFAIQSVRYGEYLDVLAFAFGALHISVSPYSAALQGDVLFIK
jgi:hypothetical protein